ncbi:MAG: hypothetical protein HOP04_08050 [Methylophilaceae bacterium]|nr:hypothetical protein [Methylophilaceae bacterium]
MKKLLSRFFEPSLEERELVDKINSIKKSYPSLKVVGRGTVMINPRDITESNNFKEDLKRAKILVRG